MLGSFAVGKTSLVQQYVNSIFSEKYHTTIGVKIDQKIVKTGNQEVNLLLWDIHGEDSYQKVKPAYVMGASGYFIVLDGTRSKTLEIGQELIKLAQAVVPQADCIILINKSDLKADWEITDQQIKALREDGFTVFLTSAKENMGVEEAFTTLTQMMIGK